MLDTRLTAAQADRAFEVLTAAGFSFDRALFARMSVREIAWNLGPVSRRSRKLVLELIEAAIEPA